MSTPASTFALLGALMALWPVSAVADAATHELTLELETLEKTDCAGNDCVPACDADAKLNGSMSIPVPLQIVIWYSTDRNSSGEAALSFEFDDVTAASSAEASSFVPGYRCEEVAATRVEVQCLSGADDRCPGYYLIQIPDIAEFGITAQKIEGK